jgi:hypothetical protein
VNLADRLNAANPQMSNEGPRVGGMRLGRYAMGLALEEMARALEGITCNGQPLTGEVAWLRRHAKEWGCR